MNSKWKPRNKTKQATSHSFAMFLQLCSRNLTPCHQKPRQYFPYCHGQFVTPRGVQHSFWVRGFWAVTFCLLSWLTLIFVRSFAIAIKQAGTGRIPWAWCMLRITICVTTDKAQTHTSIVIYVAVIEIWLIRVFDDRQTEKCFWTWLGILCSGLYKDHVA